MPLFSRLGPYDRALLGRLAYRDRALFEYWGHAASYVPIELYPAMRWRMDRFRAGGFWRHVDRLARERPDLIDRVREQIRARGAVTATDLEKPERARGPWWDWSDAKIAVEWLFITGDVAVAERDRTFARRYDLRERVIPAEVLNASALTEAEAAIVLVRRSIGALGVATLADTADYFRLGTQPARDALNELARAGEVVPVRVEGWREPAFASPEALNARANVRPSAIVSPFDPVVWFRPRAKRLFDFDYRIEIYTPVAKRVYGYYVLPFLFDGHIAARVDLKADRAGGRLVVPGVHHEPAHQQQSGSSVALIDALVEELDLLAAWLELEHIEVGSHGDLAPVLRAALTSPTRRRAQRSTK